MVNDPTLWRIRRIGSGVDVSYMQCGDEPWGQSVADFLVSDALEQQEWLFSKTTLFYYDLFLRCRAVFSPDGLVKAPALMWRE